MRARIRNSSQNWPGRTCAETSSVSFFIDVVGYDWNCQQHITPRYTIDEIKQLVAPLQQRIAELEAELKGKR